MTPTQGPPTGLRAALAATLRAERAARGYSQASLAWRAGMSKNSVLRFEKGERPMTTDQLDSLCSALGLTIEVFMARAVERLEEELTAEDSDVTHLTSDDERFA